jgi:hypothetical protein
VKNRINVNLFAIEHMLLGERNNLQKKRRLVLAALAIFLVYDSMFPLKYNGSMPVRVHFNGKDGKLIVEKGSTTLKNQTYN